MKTYTDKSPLRACPSCGSVQSKIKYFTAPFKVVKCQTCSLVYLGNPPDDSLLYEDYYEGSEYPPAAYRRDSSVAALAELYALNAQRIKWLSALKPNGKLLDLGCGRGYFLATAREHGFAVTGMDVSARALKYAQRSFGVEVTAKTLDELQEGSQKFDVITLWHVLEHFADPVGTLKKIKTLLQENGVCLVEVPNLRSLKFMLSRSKWEGGNHPRYHRTFFSSTTLQQMLRKSGFAKIRRVKLDYDLPGRRMGYKTLKRISNSFAVDAFLDYVAWK